MALFVRSQFLHSTSFNHSLQPPATPRNLIFPANSIVKGNFVFPIPAPPPSALNNCTLISALITGKIPSSTEGLPAQGFSEKYDLSFWVKTPELHTVLDGKPMFLFKYQTYFEAKYRNTISILGEFGAHPSRIFPQLYAYCDDPVGDGKFGYVLVEYVELHRSDLARPRTFPECMDRARRLMQLFIHLDEDMHLAFLDMKKGQWMARASDGSFVLNDVDDMVRTPWISPVEHRADKTNAAYTGWIGLTDLAKDIVRRTTTPVMSMKEMDVLWAEKMFPRGYTIRFTMMMLKFILIDDTGFDWEKDCEKGSTRDDFYPCLVRVLDWAATAQEDWPTPRQILGALEECANTGSFQRTRRAPASWRGDLNVE